MPRKPAILLLALLLLFSIGGAVFHHQLQKEKSSEFQELDAFLRDLPASSGQVFTLHQSFPGSKKRNHGWWDRLGIRLEDNLQSDLYYIRKTGNNDPVATFGTTLSELIYWFDVHPEELNKGGVTLILSTRRNGKLDRVGVIGPPASEDFIIKQFPKLRPFVTPISP